MLGAGVTVLGVEGFEAAAAVGPAILHDVPLPSQHRLAFKAAEVLHVPVPPFSLGAFVGKNYLGGKNTNVEQWVREGTWDMGTNLRVSCPLTAAMSLCSHNLQIFQLTPRSCMENSCGLACGTHHFLRKSIKMQIPLDRVSAQTTKR